MSKDVFFFKKHEDHRVRRIELPRRTLRFRIWEDTSDFVRDMSRSDVSLRRVGPFLSLDEGYSAGYVAFLVGRISRRQWAELAQ